MAIIRTDTSIPLSQDNLPIIAVNKIPVPPPGGDILEPVTFANIQEPGTLANITEP